MYVRMRNGLQQVTVTNFMLCLYTNSYNFDWYCVFREGRSHIVKWWIPGHILRVVSSCLQGGNFGLQQF